MKKTIFTIVVLLIFVCLKRPTTERSNNRDRNSGYPIYFNPNSNQTDISNISDNSSNSNTQPSKYNSWGYDNEGYNKDGYNVQGYDRNGWNDNHSQYNQNEDRNWGKTGENQ